VPSSQFWKNSFTLLWSLSEMGWSRGFLNKQDLLQKDSEDGQLTENRVSDTHPFYADPDPGF